MSLDDYTAADEELIVRRAKRTYKQSLKEPLLYDPFEEETE